MDFSLGSVELDWWLQGEVEFGLDAVQWSEVNRSGPSGEIGLGIKAGRGRDKTSPANNLLWLALWRPNSICNFVGHCLLSWSLKTDFRGPISIPPLLNAECPYCSTDPHSAAFEFAYLVGIVVGNLNSPPSASSDTPVSFCTSSLKLLVSVWTNVVRISICLSFVGSTCGAIVGLAVTHPHCFPWREPVWDFVMGNDKRNRNGLLQQ